MIKVLRNFPLYLKRSAPNESLEGCVQRPQLLMQWRCVCLSAVLQKKAKPKVKPKDESDAQRLEREAPFLFKALNKTKPKPIGAGYEKPLLFQPICARKQDLDDDLSHFGHETKLSLKKEIVFVVQPRVKWGRDKTKLVDHRLAEAVALVNSVHSWGVYDSCIENVQEQNSRFFFGSGKVLELSKRIRDSINNNGVTTVFLNTARLGLTQIKELEGVWGCKVFDRYRVVLELFKERAKTKEAKLQVQLAEIQYLRTHLVADDVDFDQQRGGGRSMSGAGETHIEKKRRVLAVNEQKVKKALQEMKTHRVVMKADRVRKRVPHVAMVGYTNAGKTTLAKALSDNKKLEAEDKLFATLDTTVHRGRLPSGLGLVFLDTVGFISELPHDLVESFSTTLEDVKTAELLLHVADCSHPEFELQCETVENVLKDLNISENLMRNKINVYNKIDLRKWRASIEPTPNTICISATEGTGVEELRQLIEEKIRVITGSGQFTVNLDLQGGELSWLYRHGTVIGTSYHGNGTVDVTVVLDEGNKNKFEKEFRVKFTQ